MADRRELDSFSEEVSHQEIDYNDIEIIQLIGKGSFGTVYKANWKGNVVAVKKLVISTEQDFNEVHYLSRVKHPNIIGLYGTSSKAPISIVMEYAEGGSLYNLLHSYRSQRIVYTASHAMSWCRQCADGVAYLHAMRPKPLIHRDLKPLNLLLDRNGLILKICDFGTVTDKNTLMTNNKGSAAWMAPEVFEGTNYSERCDVFSWSIILWECLSRELPFKDKDSMYSIMWMVHKGQRPPLIEGCPKPIEQLMVQCWDPSPQNRLSMHEVHQRMIQLCQFFPQCEPLNLDASYNDEESNLDTCDYESIYWETERSGMPEIRVTNTSDSIFDQGSRTPVNYYLSPSNVDARWSSGDSASPKIVSSMLNDPPMVRGGRNYGSMTPLNVDVDPNAWELKNYDAPWLMGTESAKNQGIAITKNATTKKIQTEHQGYGSAHSPQQGSSRISMETASINGYMMRNEFDPAVLQVLEPHLRPLPPANDPTSQQIYKEHLDLAQEYLKIQTRLAYLTKHKEEILQQMSPEDRQLRLDICNKLRERDSLKKLKESLERQQLENNPPKPESDVVTEEGFCVL